MSAESSGAYADRFREWMDRHDDADNPATPAATVLVLRDADDGSGLEVLMVLRNAKGTFASAWVFPGGKVDPEDFDESGDVEIASRQAAVREAFEEADLTIPVESIVPFSHWMPPSIVPRRFATWFYACAAPEGTDGEVNIDGGEVVDDVWVRPAEAIAKHAAGEVELVPPTWVTLHHLAQWTSVGEALSAIAAREPRFYVTERVAKDPPTVAWEGDKDYRGGGEPVGGEGLHRLVMAPGGWEFIEPA